MKKNIILALALLAAVVLFFIVHALFKNKQSQPVSSYSPITTTCIRNPLLPPAHFVGINIGGNAQNIFPALHDLGVTWVRTDVRWDAVEKNKGVYDWGQIDSGVRYAAKEHITLALVIGHAPVWANNLSDKDFASASARFAEALALRYKEGGVFAREEKFADYGVSYWEIFNEPNLPGYGWGNHGDDADKLIARYIETLARTSEAIRASDKNAHIILAGLSSDGMPAPDYLNALYTADVSQCFDIVAFHPYGYEGRFADAYKLIHNTLTSHGDSRVPIWFNEYGTSDESRQDVVLRDAMVQYRVPDAFFWFALVDYDQFDGHYGLLRADGKEKPAYSTFKELMHKQ